MRSGPRRAGVQLWSEVQWTGWTLATTPSLPKRAASSAVTIWACSIRGGGVPLARFVALASRSRAARLAASPMAWMAGW